MSARILIVDDTVQNIRTLSGILKDEGYQLFVATNGRQALAALEAVRPDLILLDVVMPELDGFETCRLIKAVEQWREIPIIFLTVKSQPADIVRGFEVGAVDYVAKPFNAHELLARVNTHLTVDRLRRSLAEKNEENARAHRLVRRVFGRYVSEAVADTLLHSPDALEIGGEERDVTILMSDLRGFSAMAESMKPQDVITTLNVYLEVMVEVIGRYHGTIDELIGDAILVIFGAPLRISDHAANGVACGLAMQLAMTEVNRRLAEYGEYTLEMGIGVHSGRVVVGNIGSELRTKYAAVGSNVNMAGRIQSYTSGGQVLISEATRQGVQSPLTILRAFHVEPKGAARSVELHDVVGIGEPFHLSLVRPDEVLCPLASPLSVRFTVLEEKFVQRDFHDATLTAISEHEALLETPFEMPPLGDLKIQLTRPRPAGDIYAQVSPPVGSRRPREHRVRLSWVAPEMKKWLRDQTVAGGSTASASPKE